MANILKINVCSGNQCLSFEIFETSGIYNNVDNLGGYGAPNFSIAQAVAATLEIIRPDGTVFNFDVFPVLPNTNDIPLIITNLQLGYTTDEPIEDGSWHFKYSVTFNDGNQDFVVVYSGYKFITCLVKCCRDRFAAKVTNTESCCDGCDKDDPMSRFSDVWDLYEIMMDNVACGNILEAEAILAQLQLICKNAGCNCS